MQLRVIRADDSVKHLALAGRLDLKGVNDIQYEFVHEATMLPRDTLVDLSRVTFIASIGIGMLVSVAKALEQQGAAMVLLKPTVLVRQTIEMSSLHDLIPIADDEPRALELLKEHA